MKKKLVSIFAALMAAGMLVGCGSSNTGASLKDMDVDQYVTLGEYKGLEIIMEPIVVAEADVKNRMLSSYARYVTAENGGITDRAIALGDTANIDYVGKKEGVAFEGGTAQGMNLAIGSGQFIDGFEEGLLGVVPGETVDLNLTFPEEYHSADLAGQEVVFTVTVNYIVPTDMQDEIVASMGIEGVSTVSEYYDYTYDYLYSSQEENYNTNVQNAVLSTFLNSCQFNEFPQELIDNYKEVARKSITVQAQNLGMEAEDLVTRFYGMEFEDFLERYGNEASQQEIALQAVANRENLNIDDKELEATLELYATNAGYENVKEFLGDESKETYRNYLVCEKVLEFLVENAVISNQ